MKRKYLSPKLKVVPLRLRTSIKQVSGEFTREGYGKSKGLDNGVGRSGYGSSWSLDNGVGRSGYGWGGSLE